VAKSLNDGHEQKREEALKKSLAQNESSAGKQIAVRHRRAQGLGHAICGALAKPDAIVAIADIKGRGGAGDGGGNRQGDRRKAFALKNRRDGGGGRAKTI